MAVVIRLQRTGKPKQPYFRVVAIEKGRGAAGKPIEIIGSYNPRLDKAADKLALSMERYEHWVTKGALPSETVAALVKSVQKAGAAK